MIDPNRVLSEAEALLRRMTPENRRLAARARRRRWEGLLRRFRRALMAIVGITIAAAVYGFAIAPLGIEGFMLAFLTMAVTVFAILFWPSSPAPSVERLVESDLRSLPAQTEEWLLVRRKALPAPAMPLVDGIATRLEALAPQLATLDPREPAAGAVRKLIAQELPELVDGYLRVPTALRSVARDGRSPDRQLVEGLRVVDEELGRMGADLAHGDLHRLATQQRYLEIKYRGDEPA